MPEFNFATHEVTNQSPPFCDINLFLTDRALQDAVKREATIPANHKHLTEFGAATGSAQGFQIGRQANENPPKLDRFDGKGYPLDRVEFHPAYHEAMSMSFKAGLHCSPWEHLNTAGNSQKKTSHVERLAGLYMMTQMEAGHVCPVTMTNACVPTLLMQPDVASQLLPKILNRTYDPSFQPYPAKSSVTIGMGMTEKQGGTDVRQNATTANPVGVPGPGKEYILVGHKWFMSAPMCDAFLMLAQAPNGLSCFFVPRFLPDGSTNPLRIQRLKEKLGNRSNASSEVEIAGAHGWLIGEEGRGVANIIEMVTMTRLDCAVASAGQMRLALAHAIHHCRYRTVFQRKLSDQPLMAQVLADMALDVEAATALAFRLARSFDEAAENSAQAAWRRLMTPVTKYWVCKIAPALGYEAMECLGGNGYVEDGLAARLYRELPLNAIWEGSGNVMCLDVLRVLSGNPGVAESVFDELEEKSGTSEILKNAVKGLRSQLATTSLTEAGARHFVEQLALAAAAALLNAGAPPVIADAFTSSRLGGRYHHTYGAGPTHTKAAEIVERTFPA